MTIPRRGNFEITWPLYQADPNRRLPEDPSTALTNYTPGSGVLTELSELRNVPESAGTEAEAARRLRDSVPPPAPDWMRAAQTLVNQLGALLAAPEEIAADHEAAIARAWAAWSMGGVSEAQLLRVAHLVMRAHSALQTVTTREPAELETAHVAAACVLQAGLPGALRDRMPFERILLVIRQVHATPDPWAAVVEGSAELLGWTHYARIHAAAVIRTAIEQDYAKRHVG
jgi:hypothetical protein